MAEIAVIRVPISGVFICIVLCMTEDVISAFNSRLYIEM